MIQIDQPQTIVIGKRVIDEDPRDNFVSKQQKTDCSIKIEIDSYKLEFDADAVPLKCQETLDLQNLLPQKKSSVGISNSRAKREVKKNMPYDNSEYIIDNDEPLDNVARDS
jgi:hypothetical protein